MNELYNRAHIFVTGLSGEKLYDLQVEYRQALVMVKKITRILERLSEM
ncbi:MAG: hypothetical protein Q4P25_05065 [Tissierellia bacterium]|nr:hypothetical protein [Tissierellia bacterium]